MAYLPASPALSPALSSSAALPLSKRDSTYSTSNSTKSQTLNFRDNDSIYPIDSVSNVGFDDESEIGSSVSRRKEGVKAFGGGGYLERDPYEKSGSSRGGSQNVRRQEPSQQAREREEDEDTVTQHEVSYPPPPIPPPGMGTGMNPQQQQAERAMNTSSPYGRGYGIPDHERFPSSSTIQSLNDRQPHLRNGSTSQVPLYSNAAPFGTSAQRSQSPYGYSHGNQSSITRFDTPTNGLGYPYEKDKDREKNSSLGDINLTPSGNHLPYEPLYSQQKVGYPPSKSEDMGVDTMGREEGARYGEKDRAPLWRRMLRDPTPTEEKIENYKRGIGIQKRAIGCYVLSLGLIIAFIVEIARNWTEQGKPIATNPFNPFIGPTSSILINVGARFTPCMKPTEIQNATFACLNDRLSVSSSTSLSSECTLSDICGFGGFVVPDQKFRFILPIFLHAGLIHILLNLLAQQTSVKDTEIQMGTLRFLLLYIPSGIFGFILGGNFALIGQPSVGISGCIFGTTGCNIVDLLAHWKLERRPWRRLIFVILEVVIGIGIGFIPNVDNFAHLGGLGAGLLLAILLYPVIHTTPRHKITFYILRILALPLLIAGFVLLLKNFDTDDPSAGCSWCRFLSCWPTSENNRCRGTGLQTTTVESSWSPIGVLMLLRYAGKRWINSGGHGTW